MGSEMCIRDSIKIGQIDLESSFQETTFKKIYDVMKNNLNISKIQIIGNENYENIFPYTLDSKDWKQIQLEGLKSGYKSRSLR